MHFSWNWQHLSWTVLSYLYVFHFRCRWTWKRCLYRGARQQWSLRMTCPYDHSEALDDCRPDWFGREYSSYSLMTRICRRRPTKAVSQPCLMSTQWSLALCCTVIAGVCRWWYLCEEVIWSEGDSCSLQADLRCSSDCMTSWFDSVSRSALQTLQVWARRSRQPEELRCYALVKSEQKLLCWEGKRFDKYVDCSC